MTGMFPCLVFAATIIAISGKTNDWKSCCNVCWRSQGVTCPLSSVPVQGLWNGRIFSCWLASQVWREGHSCLTTFSTVVLSTTRFGLTVMFGDCETLLYFAFQRGFFVCFEQEMGGGNLWHIYEGFQTTRGRKSCRSAQIERKRAPMKYLLLVWHEILFAGLAQNTKPGFPGFSGGALVHSTY